MLRNAMASLALGAVLLGAAGCGDEFRPPVSSISPVGPAAQPARYIVAISDPGNGQPGLFNMIDFSGDTILNTTGIGVSPQYQILGLNATELYDLNHDGSVNNLAVQSNIRPNDLQTGTLFAGADANSIFPTGNFAYITEPYTGSAHAPSIAEVKGFPPSVQQELTVAPNPIFIAGTPTSARIYAISQGATPPTSTGTVTAIQVATNSISNTFAVGTNPVYGVMTADNNRAFVLNEGSNSVSVINVNTDQLDATPGPNPIQVGNGPVWADLYAANNLLVTANSTGNSVSVLSIPLCSVLALPTNPACDASNPTDAATFGTVLATVPVGMDPQMVTILQDGTRAYVANFNATNVSQYSIAGDPATITGFSIASNVATITAANDYVAGSYVDISGVTNDGTVLNGGPYTVLAGGLSPSQFEISLTAPNQSNVANITAYSVSGNGTAPITGFSVTSGNAKLTTSGSFSFTAGQSVTISGLTGSGAFLNGGPYTVLTGPTASQFQIQVVSSDIAQTADTGTATASTAVATMTANNSFVAGQSVTITGLPAALNGTHTVLSGSETSTQFQIAVAAATTAQTSVSGTATGQITGTALEGIATITAPNNYTSGESVMLGGMRTIATSALLNGGPYKVLAAGLSATQFEVEVPAGTTAPTTDYGITYVSGTYGSVSVVSLSTFTVTKTIVFDGLLNSDGSQNINHGPYCHPNFINSIISTPTGKVYVTCPDGQEMTILETDTDTVDSLIGLQGYGVQMRVTASQ